MARKYRISSGGFTAPDGSIVGPGETIELDDDVAALHASRLVPLPEVSPEKPAARGRRGEQFGE